MLCAALIPVALVTLLNIPNLLAYQGSISVLFEIYALGYWVALVFVLLLIVPLAQVMPISNQRFKPWRFAVAGVLAGGVLLGLWCWLNTGGAPTLSALDILLAAIGWTALGLLTALSYQLCLVYFNIMQKTASI